MKKRLLIFFYSSWLVDCRNIWSFWHLKYSDSIRISVQLQHRYQRLIKSGHTWKGILCLHIQYYQEKSLLASAFVVVAHSMQERFYKLNFPSLIINQLRWEKPFAYKGGAYKNIMHCERQTKQMQNREYKILYSDRQEMKHVVFLE